MLTEVRLSGRTRSAAAALALAAFCLVSGRLSGQQVTYLPGSPGVSIVAGPDGRLWYTNEFAGVIDALRPDGSLAIGVPVPHPPPDQITVGPDGNLWFTADRYIGRITTAGVVTDFFIGQDLFVSGIAAGSDGNLWAIGSNLVERSALVVRMTPTGTVTTFRIPPPQAFSLRIASGPDGNLWFGAASHRIVRITTSGVMTEFAVPSGGARDIAAGSDGNMWFTNTGGNVIGRITPSGVVTEFPIPRLVEPNAIALGPDGNMWFTCLLEPCIGRVTMNGAITFFPVIARDLTAGPDGAIWFTTNEHRIGRMSIAGLGACVPSPVAMCLSNNRFRVELRFRLPFDVPPRDGQAVPLTGDTGAFWFFEPSNLEMMVKVLDGRFFNGRFWVFYGSLTDLEFTLTVVDTETGAFKSYQNPRGQIASVADTAAF